MNSDYDLEGRPQVYCPRKKKEIECEYGYNGLCAECQGEEE